MSITLGVVDHGAGNLVSIAQGLRASGAEVAVLTDGGDWDRFDGIVLPGVGATATAMRRLNSHGLVEPLRSWRKPLLGICVGLQLLFERSDEDGAECLNLLEGHVAKLIDAPRLPHIGWNDVTLRPDPLFMGLGDSEPFYFVHSYAPIPSDVATIIGTSEYQAPFVAAARLGNVVGVQFHPERSGPAGL
ncbi:MAG: imidazole glycerol phosphate synthase subunit HisH, partial [Acidimicrobiia bacterium]|nr:imidazole glycerol phosphate synthase subunit HisH [Acidimicrobiia bacterium]